MFLVVICFDESAGVAQEAMLELCPRSKAMVAIYRDPGLRSISDYGRNHYQELPVLLAVCGEFRKCFLVLREISKLLCTNLA